MRTKKRFSFDERKDAEEVILKGFPGGKIDSGAMYVVAKYFRDEFGFGEVRLERELIRFCTEQDKNFNPIIESDLIQKWVKSAMNYSARKIESIEISQKEIDFIKTLKSRRDMKIMFCILVISKALKQRSSKRANKGNLQTSNNYYLYYSNFSDVIAMSGLRNVKEVDLAEFLHTYREYFFFYPAEKELIRLEFVDLEPETALIVRNFDDLSEYFELFSDKTELNQNNSNKSENSCALCGEPFVKRSNNHKHCNSCAKKVRKEKQRELMRKRRESC